MLTETIGAAWELFTGPATHYGEELAGLHVLCADKTGTVTPAAALTHRSGAGDPIDTAIRAAMDDTRVVEDCEVTDFQPFDPDRKRAEAEISHGEQ